jgi:hypothetical protein
MTQQMTATADYVPAAALSGAEEHFRIGVTDAINYTSAWRSRTSTLLPLKAFTVKYLEMQRLLEEVNKFKTPVNLETAAIRLYLGKRPADPEKPGELEDCLVMTLVDGFNPDNNNAGNDIVLYFDQAGEVERGCFDFAYPCPATCARNSPLFDAQNPIVIHE